MPWNPTYIIAHATPSQAEHGAPWPRIVLNVIPSHGGTTQQVTLAFWPHEESPGLVELAAAAAQLLEQLVDAQQSTDEFWAAQQRHGHKLQDIGTLPPE